MRSEFEKMRSGELYDFTEPEIYASLEHAKELCMRLQTMTLKSADYRRTIEELIPGLPKSADVCPPFHCDHGNGITIGERTFINSGCVILDGARVSIGDDVKIGPGCQLLTPQHPLDYRERRGTRETAKPITIGDDTWLGGGVIVCPGVTIGKRCVIGAGSVVVHDIPDDSLAVGNPAVVKRSLKDG